MNLLMLLLFIYEYLVIFGRTIFTVRCNFVAEINPIRIIMAPSLPRYYKKITIIPSILATIGSLLYSCLFFIPEQSKYNSYLYLLLVHFVYSLVYSLFICFICLILFLSDYEIIRQNSFYRMLSWFLLPFTFMIGACVYELNYGLMIENRITPILGYPLLYFIIYALSISFSYNSYVKELHLVA